LSVAVHGLRAHHDAPHRACTTVASPRSDDPLRNRAWWSPHDHTPAIGCIIVSTGTRRVREARAGVHAPTTWLPKVGSVPGTHDRLETV
jgi:hypothetical protein